MNNLVLFDDSQRNRLLSKRKGEIKFGEQVQLLSNFNDIYDQMLKLDVTHVIFGISEDVGVFANYGKTGTSTAWKKVIKVLLNTQNNEYSVPNNVLILGHIYPKKALKKLSKLDQKSSRDIKQARKMVAEIDAEVSYLVNLIIKAGKIPIIVGGGHNNAYGCIKGTSLALNKNINAVNFDAHTDFRPEEGRHSGNGFSYAFAEGFLKKYFIFGIHENYTSSDILKVIKKLKKHIAYNTFESIKIRGESTFEAALKKAFDFISSRPFGVEVDCDAIENMPSSAMTPSGFSGTEARKFVSYFGKHENARYLHICEAAPNLGSKQQSTQGAKLLSYLITDFIKAHGNKD
ncbi:MAG: formimidoylglutamase [Flavobacteriaceae bacterium]|nr:formimidoylglutamase [Bacteroidia bacterium]NNK26652.1 formimidoylglutamase [Flavobacteriaceae bacterium]NNL61818.1 formimidoylglutamase [Flavobacteriaceae bacterium]